MITVEELREALGLLGLDTDLVELRSTVSSYIKPDNMGLQFDDFEALHQSLSTALFGGFNEEPETSQQQQEESDLSEAFKVFDEDGDGFISAKELQAVLAKLGLPEGREIASVQKMIVSVDQNHDGRVDFFEFRDMMRSVLVPSS